MENLFHFLLYHWVRVENSTVLLKDRGSSVYNVLKNKNSEEFYNLEITIVSARGFKKLIKTDQKHIKKRQSHKIGLISLYFTTICTFWMHFGLNITPKWPYSISVPKYRGIRI